MSVELAGVGLVTADLAIRYGKELVKLCSAFRHAGTEIDERILVIECQWTKTQYQVDLLQKIWNTLDPDHQEQQCQTLTVLSNKLNACTAQMKRVHRRKSGLDENAQVSRLKYAMIKDSINTAIQELETWSRVFDPSWYLIMRMATPMIDYELEGSQKNEEGPGSLSTAREIRRSLKAEARTSIFLPREGLDAARREPIPYCTAELMQRSSKSNKFYIVDSVPCLPEVSAETLTKDVRDLARKLSASDPLTFGLLQCHGVVKIMDASNRIPSCFNFVFVVPQGLKRPRSLRHILLGPDVDTSLSSRFGIARQLAQSVSYVHTCDFVHKSIRPDTILVFENDTSRLGASFLLGFEKFRTAAGLSLGAGDCAWEKDLYRHPRRQGLSPEDQYVMQHDIYSLGVCLLEIGLWQSFVVFDGESSPIDLLSDIFNHHRADLERALALKQRLVEIAKQKLPSKMGDKYTEVVLNCLTCLDQDNVDFGDQSEFEDEDGILIGVRYIEKILVYLTNISI